MDLDGLDLLSEQECLRLLRQTRVGRVAVSLEGVPAVFPVNYIVGGDEILFFTGDGTKLRAARSNTTVTFEVDHLDPFAETGWSVMVVGTARLRTEPAVIAGAARAGLHPWAGGDRLHLVAVAMDLVSGRRVGGDSDCQRHAPARPNRQMAGPRSPVGGVAQPPVRIGADWTLQATAETMREANVSVVLVGSDEAIITEQDLSRALSRGLGPRDRAASIAVTDLIYVDEETLVVEAAAQMLRHEIRHLLLGNWRSEVTGVVTLRDVLAVLVDAMDPAVWGLIRQTLSVGTSGTFDERLSTRGRRQA